MGSFPLTAVDVVVAVVLLGSAGFAFMRGFVHEVLSVAAWVGAVFATLYGFSHVQPFFRAQIGMEMLADGAAGLSIFLVTLLALSIATKAASQRVRESALNSVDSSLGFVFGILRGAVLMCLAYMTLAWFFGTEEQPEWLASAKTRPWLERGSTLLQGLAPEEWSGGAAKVAAEEAQRAKDIEKAFKTLSSPLPSAVSGQDAAQPAVEDKDKGKGYDPGQRRELDRLFQSKQ